MSASVPQSLAGFSSQEGGSPGIFGTWLTFGDVLSPGVFFFPPSACSPRWRRKIKKHAYPEMPLSISHQPCVVPRGEPWEFKTRSPSQNQEMHHCPPPHLPLSAVRLLCKGPRWLSITPRRAGVAKQPLCIMKRNKRAERQNGQRVNRLRDETLRSCTATVPSC